MPQGTVDDVGDNFHVPVRMHPEAHLGRDPVLVDYAQRAEMRVLGIVVVGKAEGVVGVEPAMVGVAPFVGFSNLDHRVSFVTNNQPHPW